MSGDELRGKYRSQGPDTDSARSEARSDAREAAIDRGVAAVAEHHAEWAEAKGYNQVQLSPEVHVSLREIVAIVVDTLV